MGLFVFVPKKTKNKKKWLVGEAKAAKLIPLSDFFSPLIISHKNNPRYIWPKHINHYKQDMANHEWVENPQNGRVEVIASVITILSILV